MKTTAYYTEEALTLNSNSHLFKGRREILKRLTTEHKLIPPMSYFIHGIKGVGKTSLLNHLPRSLSLEVIPLISSFKLDKTVKIENSLELVKYFINKITASSYELPKPFNYELPKPDEENLSREPFLAMQSWFMAIEKAFPSKRFLLCLDDVEYLEKLTKRKNITAILGLFRYLIQHRAKWQLFFTSSQTFEQLPYHWSDCLISTEYLHLPYLEKAESRELIENPTLDFPSKVYEPAAVEEIIRQTAGHPYLIQLMCLNLIELSSPRRWFRKTITRKEVLNSIPTILKSEFFPQLYQTLPDVATSREIQSGKSHPAYKGKKLPFALLKTYPPLVEKYLEKL